LKNNNEGLVGYVKISIWSVLLSRGEMAKHKHASHVVDGKWHATTAIQCAVVVGSDLTANQLAITRRQVRMHGLLNQLLLASQYMTHRCLIPGPQKLHYNPAGMSVLTTEYGALQQLEHRWVSLAQQASQQPTWRLKIT
jgi:hypothetical protein